MNVFISMAHGMWKAGRDGEEIAKELAEAFHTISEEGKGPGTSSAEFERLKPKPDCSCSCDPPLVDPACPDHGIEISFTKRIR